MRTNMSPLLPHTVGFDRFFDLVERIASIDSAAAPYPPYNIEKIGDEAYAITVAVAGFSESELAIESKDGLLTVSGKKAEAEGESKPVFLHRGIATRSFTRSFHLAEHIKVTGAALKDGLLRVDLVREVPESAKPRKIDIAAG